MIKRQIACIVSINEILFGKYIKEDGANPNYILTTDNKKINRVNIIGTIVNVNEESATIDDGEASISIRTFENNHVFQEIKIGDIVNLIGKPREYNSEKYIVAEMIKPIDAKWLIVRKKELTGTSKEDCSDNANIVPNEEIIMDDVVVTDEYDAALKKIKSLDLGSGVSYSQLEDIKDSVITKLLETGEIFEISPGKVKILE